MTVETALGANQTLQPYAPTETHLLRQPDVVPAAVVAQFMQGLGWCVVRVAPKKADYYLRHSDDRKFDPGLVNLGQIEKYLPFEHCFGRQVDPTRFEFFGIRISPAAFRESILEAAYLNANQRLPDPGPSGPAPQRAYYSFGDELGTAQAIGVLSDCIVANDPSDADRLLRTKPASAEEEKAAQALTPALSSCVRAGSKLSLHLADIRLFAADGLWQRYEAAKPANYRGRP